MFYSHYMLFSMYTINQTSKEMSSEEVKKLLFFFLHGQVFVTKDEETYKINTQKVENPPRV